MQHKVCLLGLLGLLGLLIFAAGVQKSVAADSLSRVTGQLKSPAAVACRGMVSLWPVSEYSVVPAGDFDNVPPWVAELAADCSFEISASPGSYYLQGVLRQTAGHNLGPLRQGDLVFMSPNVQGGFLQVDIPAGQPVNVGTHGSHWLFSGFSGPLTTGVTGRLIDSTGAPLGGLVVQAFDDPQMNDRLLAISAPSDENGDYRLRLAGAAQFYLLVRDAEGIGFPQVGRFFGVSGGKEAKLLKLTPGQLLIDQDIFVRLRTAEDRVLSGQEPAGTQ